MATEADFNPQTNDDRKETKMSISIPEYNLWKEFKDGDLEAYATIYRQYFFPLFTFGKRICNDQELIKDCIQDLFVKIWNNKENLRDTTSIKYYLFTSLKRKLLDAFEAPHIRLAADREVLDNDIIEFAEGVEDDGMSLRKKEVMRALTKLSNHQQKLLRLKYYDNLSNQEIAKELGITIQSVYNAVFKALKSLRNQLTTLLLFIMHILQ